MSSNDLNDQNEIWLIRGERFAELRQMMGYNRSKFARTFGFSRTSIENIETLCNKTAGIEPRIAKRIASAVLQEGFIVSVEWLLEGTGAPPYRLKPQVKPQINYLLADKTAKQIQDLVESNAKTLGENFLHTKIQDDAMEPIYTKGDWVIGRLVDKKNWHELKNQHCIITLDSENQKLLVRNFGIFANDKLVLFGQKNQSDDFNKYLLQPNIKSLHQIIMHIKSGQS